VLTLMQTGKARIIPLVLVERAGGTYWETWMEFVTDDLYKSGYIGAEDFKLFKIVHTPAEAVAEILQFYKVYHSARWVGDQLVLRLMHRLPTIQSIAERAVRRHRPQRPNRADDRAATGEERTGNLGSAAPRAAPAPEKFRALPRVDRRDQPRLISSRRADSGQPRALLSSRCRGGAVSRLIRR
jgi:hypothetical protein